MIHWLHPECQWLRGREGDVFSQFGEDGLVDAIFKRIGTVNRVAFECGAHDGISYSNTARLDVHGWHCFLVDSDPVLYNKCQSNRTKATVRRATIGTDLGTPPDDLFREMGVPFDLDLCVIDIDGQDYWVVHDMSATPRVLMVEVECPNKDSGPPERGETACKQAGSTAIRHMLSDKGYEVVVRTDCNAIAVRRELFPALADA